MTVYIDLLMILNFLVDYLLLLSVNRLCGFPLEHGRLLLSSVLGAAYSGFCLLPSFSFLANPLWCLVFLCLMSMTAFGMRISALRRGSLFFLLSMALGGMALAVQRAVFSVILLEALGLWLLTRISFGNAAMGERFLPVTVSSGQETVHFTALYDSGNTLSDPLSGQTVMVIGPKPAKRLTGLTEEELSHPMETLLNARLPGLRVIPCTTVGHSHSMLLALRFPNVTVGHHRGPALLAFAPEGLGNSQYEALTGGSLC